MADYIDRDMLLELYLSILQVQIWAMLVSKVLPVEHRVALLRYESTLSSVRILRLLGAAERQ